MHLASTEYKSKKVSYSVHKYFVDPKGKLNVTVTHVVKVSLELMHMLMKDHL